MLYFCSKSSNLSINDYLAGLNMFLTRKERKQKYTIVISKGRHAITVRITYPTGIFYFGVITSPDEKALDWHLICLYRHTGAYRK